MRPPTCVAIAMTSTGSGVSGQLSIHLSSLSLSLSRLQRRRPNAEPLNQKIDTGFRPSWRRSTGFTRRPTAGLFVVRCSAWAFLLARPQSPLPPRNFPPLLTRVRSDFYRAATKKRECASIESVNRALTFGAFFLSARRLSARRRIEPIRTPNEILPCAAPANGTRRKRRAPGVGRMPLSRQQVAVVTKKARHGDGKKKEKENGP